MLTSLKEIVGMLYTEQCSKATHLLLPFHSQRQMAKVCSIFPIFALYCPSSFLLLKLSTVVSPQFKTRILTLYFIRLMILRKKALCLFYISYMSFKGKLGISKQVKSFWPHGNIKTSPTRLFPGMG